MHSSLVDLKCNKDSNFSHPLDIGGESSPPSAVVDDRITVLLDQMLADNERDRDAQKEANRHTEQLIEDNERDRWAEAARAAERRRMLLEKICGHVKDDEKEEECDEVNDSF